MPYIPVQATTCPTSGNNVTISSSCGFDAGTYTFTGTLTIAVGVTVTANSNVGSGQVILVSDSIDVEGTLSADVTGFGQGLGTGAGTSSGAQGSGAGYGGNGAQGSSGTPGSPYGSVTNPVDLGSGGGSFGGAGGGAIRLTASSGTVTVNGTVTAGGGSGCCGGGGGSGGSIRIDASTIAGSGTIRANGGTGNQSGGGGAGGRIAVYYATDASTLISGSKINVFGGANGANIGGAGSVYLFQTGVSTNGDLVVDNNNQNGANTTQVVAAAQAYENVTVKRGAKYVIPNTFSLTASSTLGGSGTTQASITVNSGGTLVPPTATFTLSGVDVTNNGTVGTVTDLTVGPTATFTQNTASATFSATLNSLTVGNSGSGTFSTTGTTTFSVPTVTVNSGGTITHAANTTTKVNNLDLAATTLTVNAGGSISADAKGFSQGNGTGGGTSSGAQGSGAGYGGNGAQGSSGTPGGTYGSATAPTDLGSGGGAFGGSGGGEIRLNVSGTATISGTVTSGGNSGCCGGGGGSGGTIRIDAGTLAGSGTIQANGGTGNQSGGGGAGGRIAVYYTTDTSTLISGSKINAFGGANGANIGGAGSVYLKSAAATNGDLVVDNNNQNGANTTQVTTASQTYDNVTVKRGAKYVIPSAFTLAVAATGTLSGGGTTQPSITVNSGGEFDPPTATFALTGVNVTNNGTIGVVTDLTVGPTATFTENTATGVFSATLNSLTVGSGGSGTFSMAGTTTFSVPTVTVNSGGTLTHAANTATKANVLDLTMTTFTLNAGGTVSANGLGFTQGNGPGAGTSSGAQGSGGGYGGNGAQGSSGTPGSPYGSVTNPVDLGSAGGANGGAGGGLVHLTASGTATVNGTITATGGTNGSGGGGGSGGTVRLDVGTLAGAGSITANGGTGSQSGGGGGGGRIAVYYTTDSSTLISGGTIVALGGANGANIGGAGSVYLKSAAATNGDLVVDNNNQNGANTTQATTNYTFDNVTIRKGAKYVIPNALSLALALAGSLSGGGTTRPSLTTNTGGTFTFPSTTFTLNGLDFTNNGSISTVTDLTVTGATMTNSGLFSSGCNSLTVDTGGTFSFGGTSTFSCTTVTVKSGGTLTHNANTTSRANVIDISATTVDVQSGGTINVQGKGYAQGNGPGAGTTTASAASGGGYGGNGGNETFGSGAAGGATYGSVTNPVDIGSGGGNAGASGNGGGAIKLTVSGTLTVNGAVNANGNASSSGNSAGGSGGSVWVTAGTLAGTGTISANGGNGTSAGAGGSGAGGGRVAVFYTTDTSTIVSTAGKLQAYGGTPGGGGSAFGGGAGTIYVKSAAATNGDLVVDNNNMSATNSGSFALTTQVATLSQTYDDVTIRNAAKYVIPNTFSLSIPSSGLLTGGGTVQPTLTVSSGGVLNPPTTGTYTFSNIDVTNAGTVNTVTNLTLSSSTFTHNGTFGATLTTLTPGSGGNFVLGSMGGLALSTLTVQNGGTFTQGLLGAVPITTVTVQSGGALTHSSNATAKSFELNLSATTIDVQTGGSVNVQGKGFSQGNGTGAGATILSAASGGGYGGKGGDETFSTGAVGGSTYGSVTNPVDIGSGGGNGGTSGSGGGAVKLVASGTLTVNGTVNANGNASSSGNGAGGAGGSVWIDAGTLAGAGTVTANGGNGTSSGAGGSAGGGGRVAVYYATDSSTLISGNNVHAYGGSPGSGGSAWAGGAGTIYFKVPAATNGDVLVDNNNITTAGVFGYTAQVASTSLTFDNVTIRNGAKYSVPSTSSIAVAANMTVGGGTQQSRFEPQHANVTTIGGTLTIASNGLLTHGANGATKTAALIINAGSVDLQSGGSINVSGLGFTSGNGTGVGGAVASGGAGGAGYGGAGGAGTGVGGTGGATYGSSSDPTDIGSGGGKVGATTGGSGGGQATIVATGTFTVTGSIAASGAAAANTGTGGGSGGTVRITAFTFAGSGAINADGGAGQGTTGGCGGGGRISINYTVLTYSGAPTVAGACSGAGTRAGANGTYVTTQDPNPVPTTTSISPSSGTVGDVGFTIDVFGSNFVPSSVVRWAGADRTTTYVSGTHLTASILTADLSSAGTFTVTAFNPLPGGGTSNAQTFTVNNPGPGGLTTTSISPTNTIAGGPTFTLTVNGTGFVSTSVVRWNGSDRTTTFVSSTQVTASIPDTDIAAAGTATVTVFNPTPGGGTSNGQTFTINNPVPTTTSITPSQKTVGDPGFTITVDGTDFLSTSVVRFDGSDRTTTFVNATQLTASIPPSDLSVVGTFTITVFNPTPGGGVSNGQTFTVGNPVPVLSSLSPTGATVNSAAFTLTVNGADFLASSVVRWNGSDRTTTFVSAAQLTAAIPSTDLAAIGSESVTVFNPAPGGGLSSVATFMVRSAGGGITDTGSSSNTTPPVISAVAAVNVASDSARVEWTTDVAATSRVDYGTTAAYGSQVSEYAFVTTHGMNLIGLAAGTVYHFRACSADPGGNLACSDDATFTTLGGADTTPPVISDVVATPSGITGADIAWTTDEAATTFVDYGTVAGPPYAATAGSASALTTAHALSLSGLLPATVYHYRVRSADVSGNEAASEDTTFTTPASDTTPPVITDLRAGEIAATSAAVLWSTDEPADAAVDYGTTASYGSAASSTDVPGTAHRVALGPLAPDTVYHVRAISKDASGNVAAAPDLTFTTLKPPPPAISGVAAGDVTLTSAKVTWTTDVAAASRVDYGTTAGYGRTLADVTPSTAHALTLIGLAQDTEYHFRVRADDAYGQTTLAPDATFRTLADHVAPGDVGSFAAAPDVGEISLSWTNPADADLRGVLIMRKTGSAPRSTGDGTRVYDSSGTFHLDPGLADGTEYFYKAFAFDAAGNYAPGVIASATTPVPCRDTDGQDHGTRGTVTAGGVEYVDVCVDAHRVEEQYCDGRQHQSAIYDCGPDDVCEAGRCVAAPVPPTAPATCGNGTCDAGETPDSCAADCAPPPVAAQPGTVPANAEARPAAGNLRFYAGAGGPELSLSYTGEIRALPSTVVRVYVPDAAVRKNVKDGFILFAGKTYPLRETRSYEALVTAPPATGSYPMTVVLDYQDGTADAFALTLSVESGGMVYEKQGGKNIPVAGAAVTLSVMEGGGYVAWQPSNGGSANPQTTGADGAYAFLAPAGRYRIRAEKDGYATMETLPFDSIGGFVKNDLELVPMPKPIQKALADALASGSVAQRAGAAASVLAKEASFRAKVAARDIKEFAGNPIVKKQTERVAAPAVVVVATVNVAAGAAATATAVPYAMYLVSFIAHPTLLIARRRRKKWGTVYNALTKLPLDLAIVRLVDAKTGRIVRSAVTDKEGRYFFIVPKGEYKLIAIKAGYAFPTSYLKGETQDVSLPDLYHGEGVAVQEEASITANIPLDPSAKEKTPSKVVLEGAARRLQTALAIASVLAMAVATAITPSPKVIAIFAGNAVMFLVFRRLSVTKKPKNWGIVYDDATGKPVRSAVARIFDTKYNKLLETQVTDARGRYAFLVGDNVYSVTFEKPGYMKLQKGPVNLTRVEKKGALDRGIVAVDVRLPQADAQPKPPAVQGEEPRHFPAAPPIQPRSDMPAGIPPEPAASQPGTPHVPGITAPPMPDAGPGPVVPTPYQGIEIGTGPPRAGPTASTGPPAREGPAGGEGTAEPGVVTGEPPKASSP